MYAFQEVVPIRGRGKVLVVKIEGYLFPLAALDHFHQEHKLRTSFYDNCSIHEVDQTIRELLDGSLSCGLRTVVAYTIWDQQDRVGVLYNVLHE